MAISPHLIPYRVVKSLSTRLTRHSNPPSKLSSTQEALAKAMGYEGWRQLSTAYDTFQLSPQLQVFGARIDRTLDAGYRRLVMEVREGYGTIFSMETLKAEVILIDEVEAQLGTQIATIFHNVLMDNVFTAFDSKRVSSGYALVGISRGIYHIDAEFMPTQKGFVATFDLYEVESGVYLPDFFDAQAIEELHKTSRLSQGIVFVVSRSAAHRSRVIQSIASLTKAFRPTTVVSPTPMPMLRVSKSLRCVVQDQGSLIREASLLSGGSIGPAYLFNSSDRLYDISQISFPKNSLIVVGLDEVPKDKKYLLPEQEEWPISILSPNHDGSVHTLIPTAGVFDGKS